MTWVKMNLMLTLYRVPQTQRQCSKQSRSRAAGRWVGNGGGLGCQLQLLHGQLFPRLAIGPWGLILNLIVQLCMKAAYARVADNISCVQSSCCLDYRLPFKISAVK